MSKPPYTTGNTSTPGKGTNVVMIDIGYNKLVHREGNTDKMMNHRNLSGLVVL